MSVFYCVFILIGGQLFYNTVMVFAIHQYESAIGIHVSFHPEPHLPPPSPPYPPRLSQSTGFGCPALCIKLTLVICFTYGNYMFAALFKWSHTITLALSSRRERNRGEPERWSRTDGRRVLKLETAQTHCCWKEVMWKARGRKGTVYEKRPLADNQQGNGDLRYTAT